MFHFLRRKNLLLRFNSIQALRIQFIPISYRKCHYGTKPPSSLIQYLQTSLGFSSERALTLSRRFKGNPKNPDSVIAFFKSHGLSETQIKSIINRVPSFLSYFNAESSLRPKLQFLSDKGASESDLADLMVSNPHLFTSSIEGHIKPVLDLLRSILGTDEFAVQLLILSKLTFNPHLLSSNLSILRNCGVQNHHLRKLFMRRPKVLLAKSDRFNWAVERIKGMGLKPQSSLFVQAVFVIVGLSRQTWDARFKVYASLGWSAEEILSLFCKQPICLTLSEKKIRKVFDYLNKELGWGPPYILIHPSLLTFSLEKRIIPRHRFLQVLASKRLIKKAEISAFRLNLGEEKFLKNYVTRYESEVPDILKIYEGLIGPKLLNIKDGKDHNVH